MNPRLQLINHDILLTKVLNEITDFRLAPDAGTASRRDLIAELLWIASRIRRLRTLEGTEPCAALPAPAYVNGP